MTITEFLEARIAEDEQVADRAAATEWFTVHNIQGKIAGSYGVLVAEHMVRFDPARLLAECAAKRAIIAGRERIDRSANDDEWSMGYSDANYEALRALVAVYASHPDYRQEWVL